MSRAYTGVGSRETPAPVRGRMIFIAKQLGHQGWTLRSGGADGADSAFETGAYLKEIYLPWERFNQNDSPLFGPTEAAYAMAKRVHPRWHALDSSAKALHARNVHQVLGLRLDSPSLFLVCWTPGGRVTGGTATAIRVAIEHKVPVFNLTSFSANYVLARAHEIAGK